MSSVTSWAHFYCVWLVTFLIRLFLLISILTAIMLCHSFHSLGLWICNSFINTISSTWISLQLYLRESPWLLCLTKFPRWYFFQHNLCFSFKMKAKLKNAPMQIAALKFIPFVFLIGSLLRLFLLNIHFPLMFPVIPN